MNRLDTSSYLGKTSVSRTDYYLVEHYKDNDTYNKYIDSFANKWKVAKYSYYNYTMVFYKETENTNLKGNLLKSNIIDKYTNQDDLIYDFIWSEGKYLMKNKYKDGKYVLKPDDKKVIIEDIKQ